MYGNKVAFLENFNKITSSLFTLLFNTTWKVERAFKIYFNTEWSSECIVVIMTPLIKASIATGEDYNIARKDTCELCLRKCFWQIIVYTLYLHIIPQINWELKTRVCIDWLYKDIDCNYFGALLQRTLKNYGAFFIILNKPYWKYKISWSVGTSPSSACPRVNYWGSAGGLQIVHRNMVQVSI